MRLDEVLAKVGDSRQARGLSAEKVFLSKSENMAPPACTSCGRNRRMITCENEDFSCQIISPSIALRIVSGCALRCNAPETVQYNSGAACFDVSANHEYPHQNAPEKPESEFL